MKVNFTSIRVLDEFTIVKEGIASFYTDTVSGARAWWEFQTDIDEGRSGVFIWNVEKDGGTLTSAVRGCCGISPRVQKC